MYAGREFHHLVYLCFNVGAKHFRIGGHIGHGSSVPDTICHCLFKPGAECLIIGRSLFEEIFQTVFLHFSMPTGFGISTSMSQVGRT